MIYGLSNMVCEVVERGKLVRLEVFDEKLGEEGGKVVGGKMRRARLMVGGLREWEFEMEGVGLSVVEEGGDEWMSVEIVQVVQRTEVVAKLYGSLWKSHEITQTTS